MHKRFILREWRTVTYVIKYPEALAVKLVIKGFQSRPGQTASARGVIFDPEVKNGSQPAGREAGSTLGAGFTRR